MSSDKSSHPTTGAKGPKPTDWHTVAKGVKVCPVCGVPRLWVGNNQHRATTPADKTEAKWFKRWQWGLTWRVAPLDGSTRKRPRRPSPETAAMLGQTALLMAGGESLAGAARFLGVTPCAIGDHRKDYADFYQALYEGTKDRFNALAEKTLRDGQKDRAGEWTMMMLKLKQQRNELRGRLASEDPGDVPDLSPQMTLTQFFNAYAWPFILSPKGNCEATRNEYLRSLRHWTRLVGDPPIDQITKQTCSTFLQLLREIPSRLGGKLSSSTVFKHHVTIQSLIAWTGPPDRHNPAGADLVASPPWLPSPRRDHQPPRPGFTLAQIWDWLEVVPQTAQPFAKIGGFDSATWWRAVILTAYNTGMRPGMLFRVTWEMLDGQRLTPPPSISKGHRGHLVWLNDAAMEAIEPLRRSKGPIFIWPDYPQSETTIRYQREMQQRAAGIPERPLYALRRTFATQCGKISPMAMQLEMGHVAPGLKMATEHYIDAEAVLSDALRKLPQPAPPDKPQQTAA